MKIKALEDTRSIKTGAQRIARKTGIDNRISAFVEETFNGFIGAEDFNWHSTRDRDQIESCNGRYKGIGNLERLNDVREINKFLETANENMTNGEYLLVCAETKNSRRKRIFNKFPSYISFPYYTLDFMLKRVFPKWGPTYKIYYNITKGKNRVLTNTETLGRLYSCGFKMINQATIGYNTYYIAKKAGAPAYNMEPTYGSLIRLKRVGHREKLITVYKVRTMHPYSEYLQEHLYNMNGSNNGDKIENDFRVTNWGKWFRKLWIDELPMIWNFLKGDMKLVGVRPLSRHKFSTYPEWLQDLRTKFKPGLVPPFYADLPETAEDFYYTEAKYLAEYEKKPIRTDIKYLFKAMYNIFIKRARSA